jgi:hypothetical protein
MSFAKVILLVLVAFSANVQAAKKRISFTGRKVY